MGLIKAGALSFLVLSLLASCNKKSDSPADVEVYCENGELKEVGIFGGKVLNEDSWLAKGVVLLLTFDPIDEEKMSICTGTLIDNNVVLTAGHCVGESRVSKTEDMLVAFSVDPICNIDKKKRTDLLRRVAKIERHPDYNDLTLSNDMAMLRFDGDPPTGFHSVPVAFKEIPFDPQTKVYLSGYGKETNMQDKDKRTIRLKVGTVKPFGKQPVNFDHASDLEKLVHVTVLNNNTGILFDQSGEDGGCLGDSGGPALIKGSNSLKIIGVASFVTSMSRDKKVTCHEGMVYASTRFYEKWIKETFEKIKDTNSLGLLAD